MSDVMDYKAIAIWATGRETGMSSKAMARHFLGVEHDKSYPRDGGDFGRCEALLNACPDLRGRLGELAEISPYWAALVPMWDAIRQSEDRTAKIRAIIRPIQDADKRVVRLGDNVTMTFGR